MTAVDPALPISGTAATRALTNQVDTLARRYQFAPVVLPHAVIGGTPRPDGYQSIDSTSYVEMFRADGWLSAPYLLYDLQVTGIHGTAPTSIDWRIQAVFTNPELGSPVTITTGTGVSGTQFTATIELFGLVGELALSEYVSFRVAVKRTGGAGEAAGIRLVRPWILQTS
jgi:hypothetical protein